jgi:putative ATP-dependent endonuclease of OLD family
MKISRVVIKNWRSVKHVDFQPAGNMTILIGANNAGKSNILSAINFLIGDRWPMSGNLLDTDFYLRDRKREIHIQLDFQDAAYSRLDFATERGSCNLQVYDARTGALVRGFTNEERSKLAFAYADADRRFERQLAASRYVLLGQAQKILYEDLRRDNDGRLAQLRTVLNKAHELLKTDPNQTDQSVETDLYKEFEAAMREVFAAQPRASGYDVQFEFRPRTNSYRSAYLALFHAFASAFRGGAIFGIEEPELFLSPSAQRSLMRQFEALVAAGNQLFISSHSAIFLDITQSERIVAVENRPDDEGETCTQVRTTTTAALLAARQKLHANKRMSAASMRAFLRNVGTLEMAEPYFGRLVIVTEGLTEREALPLLCAHLGLKFDDEGVSIVAARGKIVIDTLVQLYDAHAIPTYVIFDNNDEIKADDKNYNRVLCRLLGLPETDAPAAATTSHYAILSGNWEAQMKADLEQARPGLYDTLQLEARASLGLSPEKENPLVARYIAERLVAENAIPGFVREITHRLKQRVGLALPPETALSDPDEAMSRLPDRPAEDRSLNDDLPFGLKPPASKVAAPAPKNRDAQVAVSGAPSYSKVQAVFGDVPREFQTRAYTRRSDLATILDDPEVLKTARSIVNANRRTKIETLEPKAADQLRLARRLVRHGGDRRSKR